MSGFSLEISYLQIYKGSKGQLCLEQLNPQVWLLTSLGYVCQEFSVKSSSGFSFHASNIA